MTRAAPVDERLARKLAVDPVTGCQNYTGSRDSRGYGRMTLAGGRSHYPHRIAYELAKGPIPDGLVIDHLCRNPSCCNPEHLEAVTATENVRRGKSRALKVAPTHCPQGHIYDQQNTRINQRGHRLCRTCRNAEDRVRPRRHPKPKSESQKKSEGDE